jgi:hypothetical protein
MPYCHTQLSIYRYSQFELALIMVPRPDGTIAGKIEYNTDIFNVATMEVCRPCG